MTGDRSGARADGLWVREYKVKGGRAWRIRAEGGRTHFDTATEAGQSLAGLKRYPHERLRNVETREIVVWP